MIDTFKLQATEKGIADRIWNNPIFEDYLISTKKKKEEETVIKYKKDYKNIINLNKKGNDVFISIKLQHLYNLELGTDNAYHNASLFTATQSINTIHHLQKLLTLNDEDLEFLKITSIELNTKIFKQNNIEANNFINKVFKSGTRSFVSIHDIDKKFTYKESKGSYCMDKVYNKSEQYSQYCKAGTIAIERRIEKNRNIYKLTHCKTLEDLKCLKKYTYIAKELTRFTDGILLLDWNIDQRYSLRKLNKRELSKINLLLRANYWQVQTKNNHNTFSRKKKDYINLIEKIGCNIHNSFKSTVKTSLNKQLRNKNKTCKNVAKTPTKKQVKTSIKNQKNVAKTPYMIKGVNATKTKSLQEIRAGGFENININIKNQRL